MSSTGTRLRNANSSSKSGVIVAYLFRGPFSDDWISGRYRNGLPQKKQNRFSAFTMVPQFGQRFLAPAKVEVDAVGVDCAGAGRTNSIGGGGLSARGWTAVAVGGGCEDRVPWT